MIDLHCHILPGLDDGASDLDDSAAMAEQAELNGVTQICATPHIRHDHDVRIAEIADRVDALNAALANLGRQTRILTGGEVAESIVEHLDVSELRAVSLGGGGRWVLLEPAPGPLSDGLGAAVRGLERRGFRSLIAHPERHLGLDLFERLGALTRAGALVQVTAATMVDHAAAVGMLQLARAGVVHVLGSDAHSAKIGRPVDIAIGLEPLWEVDFLTPHIEWIVHQAPAAIVRGDDVEPPYRPLT